MGFDHIVFHAICIVKHFFTLFLLHTYIMIMSIKSNMHTSVTLKSHLSAHVQLQTSAFVVALEQQLLVAGTIFSVGSMKDSC